MRPDAEPPRNACNRNPCRRRRSEPVGSGVSPNLPPVGGARGRRNHPDAAAQIIAAVVWAPPVGFLGQFPNLERIVSIGRRNGSSPERSIASLACAGLCRSWRVGSPRRHATRPNLFSCRFYYTTDSSATGCLIERPSVGRLGQEARWRAARYLFSALDPWRKRRPSFCCSLGAR
jgi:hypothetical protein